MAARRLRHRPAALDRLGYPNCYPEADHASGALKLLHCYLTDPDVFERGQRVIEVRATAQETEAVTRLQAWLRHALSTRAIAVESNPSSNFNSDDPLTFATCLADEYAYFYAALLHAGVATPRALTWLGQAREAGRQSRFTYPGSRSGWHLGWGTRRLAGVAVDIGG